MNVHKKAKAYQQLKTIQRQLALAGYHQDALNMGELLAPHTLKLACAYLGVKDLPDGLNGVLVRELALAVAGVDAKPNIDLKLRSALRVAAWSNNKGTTEKLENAKAALPDLMKVIDALQ